MKKKRGFGNYVDNFAVVKPRYNKVKYETKTTLLCSILCNKHIFIKTLVRNNLDLLRCNVSFVISLFVRLRFSYVTPVPWLAPIFVLDKLLWTQLTASCQKECKFAFCSIQNYISLHLKCQSNLACACLFFSPLIYSDVCQAMQTVLLTVLNVVIIGASYFLCVPPLSVIFLFFFSLA